MSSQFHSHLMRQIISTARHQARPPVALVGWINGDDANDSDPDNDNLINVGDRTRSTTANSLTTMTQRRTPSTSTSSLLSRPSSRPVLLQRRTSPGGGEVIPALPGGPGDDDFQLSRAASSEVQGRSLLGVAPAPVPAPAPAPATSSFSAEAPTHSSSASSSLYGLAAASRYEPRWPPSPAGRRSSNAVAGPRRRRSSSHSGGAAWVVEEGDPSDDDDDREGEGGDPSDDPRAEETTLSRGGGANVAPASARTTTSQEMVPAEELPRLFQDLIVTRRTRSHFAPLGAAWPKDASVAPDSADDGHSMAAPPTQDYWRMALDRAVVCGHAAPNHRRTEPFTFRRLLAPSAKTTQLADIAYEVHLRKQRLLLRQQQQQQATRVGSSSTLFDEPDNTQAALRKRDKWNAIPAFLVATVASPSLLRSGGSDAAIAESASERTRTNDTSGPIWYEPTPYVPPGTIRELEDYASCSAAVQNVLLSLHSEGIATKWATGDVIRTPAFRNLMEIPDDERVVALVQVGHPAARAGAAAAAAAASPPSSSAVNPPRRHRRQLKGDVLVDL